MIKIRFVVLTLLCNATLFFTLSAQPAITPTVLQKAFDVMKSDSLFRHANIGFHMIDLHTKNILIAHQPEISLTPASTIKILTGATALEIFGPEHRFETWLQYDGKIEGKTLNGNLYIKGSGDPTIHSTHFKKKNSIFDVWANAIKSKLGIEMINGDIIGDASLFPNTIPGTWAWEDIANYFGTSVNALTVNDNLYKLYLQSGKVGSQTILLSMQPTLSNLQFHNYVTASTENIDNAYIFGTPDCNIRIIRGTIPQNKTKFTIKGSLPDPALFASQYLKKALQNANILVKGKCKSIYDNINTNRKLIYIHKSERLIKIVDIINKKSVNLFAELLLHHIGLALKNTGNRDTCIAAIKKYWNDKGLNTNGIFLYDGSGLSPYNAINASFFTSLLSYLYENSNSGTAFYHSLPQAGVSGTMKYFHIGEKNKGKLRAKTGTMKGVIAYAGYITTEKERSFAFAIIINHFSGKPKIARSRIRQFFRQILNSK